MKKQGIWIFAACLLISNPLMAQEDFSDSSSADEILKDVEANPALLEDGGFDASRDPFADIFNPTKSDDDDPRPEGLGGMDIDRVTLRGILSGAFGDVALILGTDKQLYNARIGQQFFDGKLVAIESEKIVFEKKAFDQFGKPLPPIIREKPLHKDEGRAQSGSRFLKVEDSAAKP